MSAFKRQAITAEREGQRGRKSEREREEGVERERERMNQSRLREEVSIK